MIYFVFDFVGFECDFLNGEGEMMKLLIGWFYEGVGKFDIFDFYVVFGIICFEVLVFLWGIYSLVRQFNLYLL